MKKVFGLTLLLSACFTLFGANVQAANLTDYVPHKVIVKFQEDFSTKNPPKEFSVVMNDTYVVKNKRTVEEGTVLYLELTKVSKEKIGKQNASVTARIVKVYVPSQDKTIDVTEINPNAYVKFSQYEKLDVKDKALDASISVANKFVSNISYPAHFVKGAVKNESGNRLKSGLYETYDSSILSYASIGKPLVLKSGDLATLTYFTKNMNNNSAQTETVNPDEVEE